MPSTKEPSQVTPTECSGALQTTIIISEGNAAATLVKPHLLKRYAAASFLALLLLYLAFASLYRSSRTFFWYDEVLTVAVTNQHSFSGIWNALENAADGNPPPFYAVEEFSSRLFSDEHLGYRIPSILGFLCVPIALFCLVRTRLGDLAGLIAALSVLFTSVYSAYSIEGRPYALVVGIIAIALLVWQHANQPRTAVLLALLLASATALHFYAALALVPFTIGEAVRTVRLQQWRFHVWIALGCACIPLLAFFPLLWQHKKHLGAHFWARPGVFSLSSLYLDLFGSNADWQALIAFGLITIAFGVLAAEVIRRDRVGEHVIPTEEGAAMLGFVLLPAVAYLVAHVTGAGITGRYTLPAMLGISFGLACLAHRLGRLRLIVMLVLILCSFAFQEAHYWVRYGNQRSAQRSSPVDNQVLAELLDRSNLHNLPVVVSEGLSYLPMAYYSGLRKKSDLFYLVDAPKAIQYAETDSLDNGLSIVSAYLPINVRQFPDFARQHNKFLLYSIDNTLWDWWPRRLRDDGYLIRPVAARLGRTLYFVDLRHKAISSVVSSP